MSLIKGKRKLNKLIQQSDSEESDHELSYYVNDRIKLMKEVLKIVKPKKIKVMAPSCLRDTDIEEINSMLLEELLGISNKRLKYIFNGQSLDEDSSSTSEDKPVDVISLDEISDDELVINIDDDEGGSVKQKTRKRESKHHRCRKEKVKNSVKQEKENNDKKTIDEGEGIASNKNLMSVLELLELQARARAIKSQLLLENAKTQEIISLSKIPTLEEKVGSDDEVIIKTAKTEEIIITSSESDTEDLEKRKSMKNENEIIERKTDNILYNEADSNEGEKNKTDTANTQINEDVGEFAKINIIENRELTSGNKNTTENSDKIQNNDKLTIEKPDGKNIDDNRVKIKYKNTEKSADNDEIIQINLSEDEMDELK